MLLKLGTELMSSSHLSPHPNCLAPLPITRTRDVVLTLVLCPSFPT